jgi:4,5-epoxidase
MGGARWRVVMPNAGQRGGVAPSFEEIQELVAERAPRPLTLSDPTWLSCFRCHLRVTSSYRCGRVLLAGDAAHVHSPAGGQGMNTGMLDADNLAWKLALVADRVAPDALLDTYGQERRPVAAGVISLTDRMVALMTMRQPLKRAVRDAVLPTATRLAVVQRRASRRLSQTAATYAPGPLVRSDTIRRGPKPGERCPDIEVRIASSRTARLHRLLGAGRPVLVVSHHEACADLAAMGLDRLVDVVDGDLGAAFTLVRPDRVVAVRAPGHDPGRILDYLQWGRSAERPGPNNPSKIGRSGPLGTPERSPFPAHSPVRSA